MTKILHLDCVGGVSGDMFFSAVSGLPIVAEELERILGGLPLPEWSYRIKNRREVCIAVRQLELDWKKPEEGPSDPHAIGHLIAEGSIPEAVRRDALAMLDLLVHAEAGVHGVENDHLHFQSDRLRHRWQRPRMRSW